MAPRKKTKTEEAEVSRTIRDEPPTHFLLRIDSFSFLSSVKYYSGNFQAGGYKWKLCLYPNGNKDKNGEVHISLYLEMVATDSLSPGWEVHALFRLFVLDQLSDNYLTLQDINERPRRFRATTTQYGFDRLISLEQFNDPKNGYLVQDACVFGAEVFVHKESVIAKMEQHLMPAESVSCIHTWKIEKFSELVKEFHCSDIFTAAGHNWRIKIYPKGYGQSKGKSLSLFLEFNGPTKLLPAAGVLREFKLLIMDQLNGKHAEYKWKHWFKDSSKCIGFFDCLALSGLSDQSKGYLMKDVCIIEAHILHTGTNMRLSLI